MFRVPPEDKRLTVAPVMTCITNAPAVLPFTVMIAGDIPGNDFSNGNPLFSREIDPHTLGGKPWMLFEVNPSKILDKIKHRGSPLLQALLGEYFLADGPDTGRLIIGREAAARVQKKDPIVRSFLLPYVCPDEITPYTPVEPCRYVVIVTEGTTKKLAGGNHDTVSWFSHHHTTFFNLIEGISGSSPGKAGYPWEWSGPNPPHFLHGPVLLFSPGTRTSRPGWAIAPHGAYPGPGVVALPGRDLSLLGILNSTVFWLYMMTSEAGLGTNRYDKERLHGFPLYIPDPECGHEMELYSTITRLVKRRVALLPESGNSLSTGEQSRIWHEAGACESAINRAVYTLYGMSADDANAAGYLVFKYMQKLQDNKLFSSGRRNPRV